VTARLCNDLERLYQAMQRLESGLGGKRTLAKCGSSHWPTRGVYLFFEAAELRPDGKTARVVRVGTHGVSAGSKSTLWQRLSQHRGPRGGAGSHRGSVFRRHVGHALATRVPSAACESWGVGQTANPGIRQQEEPLEKLVSQEMAQMSLLWLAIDDKPARDCDRAYIERNLIGLLSAASEPPSVEWLGNLSREQTIRNSGLWNLNHVGDPYHPKFLAVLDEYVDCTIGRTVVPTSSIAPVGWYGRK
jgi:hypothetical protein